MQRLWRTPHSTVSETASGDAGDHTAEEFATFFTAKIASVRASIAATPLYDVPYKLTLILEDWTTVMAEKVKKLIGV